MLDRLTADDFRPYLGQSLRVDTPSGPVDFELTVVTALPAQAVPAAAKRVGFWIHLLGPGPGHLPQGIYTVHHPALGPMGIFLVPLGPHDGRMRYEAIFN